MKKIENIQKITKLALCGLCLILTGCGAASLAQESTFESAYENGSEEENINIFTSSACVVVASICEEDQALSLFNIDGKEAMVLSYDGATLIQDKYKSPMSIAQLQEGDIAEITYNKELERLGAITLSGDAWRYEGISKYSFNQENGSITIGDENYGMESGILAFSAGRPINVNEIIHQDVLSFNGKGNKVMSITVDQGHGYLELLNAEALLGGWIEVGQTLISQIAPDMLLTIPEGSYTIRLSSDGIDETRDVVIERDKVTSLDLGDIEIPAPENGVVIFEITPATARVSVDNEILVSAPDRGLCVPDGGGVLRIRGEKLHCGARQYGSVSGTVSDAEEHEQFSETWCGCAFSGRAQQRQSPVGAVAVYAAVYAFSYIHCVCARYFG